MRTIKVGLITLIVFLMGCPADEEDPWTQIELISDVVWSDDQHAIAYTLERYEEKREGTAPYFNVQTRNHRYSVWIANPDGSEARERLSLQPTRPLGELRYYRSIDALFIHDSRENRRVAWAHPSDGGAIKLAESNEQACDGLVFTTLPSADGARVAIVHGDEDPACLENATTNATVSIVSTADQTLVMGPLTLGFATSSPEMSWTPSGDFVLSDLETTYRIAESEWDLSPLPGCFEPATTSDRRGVDGRTIWYEDGSFATEPSDQVWGCHCEADGAALYCR